MKTRVSRWENGHDQPGDFYLPLLCEVFGATADDLLGREAAPGLPALSRSSAVPSLVVTGEVVTFLETVFTQYAQADRLLGPRAEVGVVREQCRMIESLVAAAREPIRGDILRIGTRFFEFAGWLAQDSGDLDAAASWSSKALDMAHETGDEWLTSYVFMRRSNIATDAGNSSDGLGLAMASLRVGERRGRRLHALGLRQRANALALAGDARGCAQAIDQAMEAVTSAAEPEPLAKYCTPSYVQMEAAACWTRLGRPDRAADLLAAALANWPAHDQRDRGIGLARLASAHAIAGTVDGACVAARDALGIVQLAPSARAITELGRLRARLAPHRRNREVAELTDQLRTLAHP